MQETETAERNLDVLFKPLTSTGKQFYLFIGLLISFVLLGVFAWYIQLTHGLIVTGMRNTVFWGVYETNFVFFIGISHAGTLLSAILRVTNTEWRRPVTRIAEAITVFALIFAVLQVIFSLGRPERIFNVLFYGRIESPLLWDFISVTTYLVGSFTFLYLPLIPDIALCRDKVAEKTGFLKRKLYRVLSLNWRGVEEQRRSLEKAIGIMAILIIPIAVSVHTVVSWVFSMTLRVGWHSSIFGPYFVVAAIFSGIATLIIAMAIFRRVYHLEGFIKPLHFKNLGYLLLTLDLAYLYFTVSEYLTSVYGGIKADIELSRSLFLGEYALPFYIMVLFGFVIPAVLIAFPKTRTIPGIVAASLLVDIALWIKRYIIVVPTIARPLIPGAWGLYIPTGVEWSVTAGSIAGFILAFTIFSKVFPVVSIWEVSEEG